MGRNENVQAYVSFVKSFNGFVENDVQVIEHGERMKDGEANPLFSASN